MKNIIQMSLEELKAYREELVQKHICEYTKPIGYFDKLTDIDILIKSKQ